MRRGIKWAARQVYAPVKDPQKKQPLPEFIHVPHDYVLRNVRDVKQSSKKIPPEINPTIDFYVIGCGGTGESAQKQVAELMDKIARGEIKKPKFIIILGDNFYKHGVASEKDEQFKTKFEDVYEDKKLTGICGIPCFLIPGNHDHDVQLSTTDAADIDYFRILGQINYSRLKQGIKSPELDTMFKSSELDLKKLGSFNMPSRYYSLLIEGERKKVDEKKIEVQAEVKEDEKDKGESDLLMCFLDTTTLPKDYLNYLKLRAEGKEDPNNQISWLIALARKYPNTIKLKFSHHSNITKDKRAFDSDASDYLSQMDIKELSDLGINGNYNEILNGIFKLLKSDFQLDFRTNFSAHTHSLYYYNSLCDLFLMAPPSEKNNYKISDKNKLYLYQGADGGIFYLYEVNNVTYQFELPEVESLTKKLNAQKFDQPEENPQKCQNYEFYQAVLNVVSRRGHVPDGLCQVGSGGGGGKLEYRCEYDPKDKDKMMYSKNHGMVKVSVDLSKGQDLDCLTYDYFTTKVNHLDKGLHFKFKSDSSVPIRDAALETPEVIQLRKAVTKACSSYLFNTNTSMGGLFTKPTHHGLFGMNRAQEMINFFNNCYEAMDYDEALSYMVKLMGIYRSTWVDEHSLETILKKVLKEDCNIDYDLLIARYAMNPGENPPSDPGVVINVASSVINNLGALASQLGNKLSDVANPYLNPTPSGR